MSDILIVYYSRTGKTRMVAQKLADILDADIEEIREAKDRSGRMGWITAGKDSLMNKPAELISEHSLKARKAVIIGTPVWANRPPPAVRVFLSRYDLAGKTVCAFCTHDGGGGKGLFAKMAELIPGGLAATLAMKKPKPDDPVLDEQLRQWAEEIREACG